MANYCHTFSLGECGGGILLTVGEGDSRELSLNEREGEREGKYGARYVFIRQ